MKIEIRNLELTNFKCFKHKEISFDRDVTVIRGRNGVGKTTIADAILWCFFGKNSQGQATFDLKTHDADGKAIPNIDHSVEMTLVTSSTDDATFEITLRRTLKETWVKKRGSDEQVFKNNTTEYFINGDTYTAKDYEKYISNLVSEDIFRAITNPQYFPSLKWQAQREFLTKMVGDIDSGAIATTDELVDLANLLDDSGEDIVSYRKHLSYQIKQIKEKIDKIPVRLEEQNKALPELFDWDSINSQKASLSQQLQVLSDEIFKIKSGNGGDVLRAEIRAQIEKLNHEINTFEDNEREIYRLRIQEHDSLLSEAQRMFNSLLNTQKDIELQQKSFDNLKIRCQETLEQCEKDAQKIREEWKINETTTNLEWDEADSICPVCGQYLPHDQLQEKKRQAIERFNERKARVKSELIDRANKVKAIRAEAEKELKDLDDKKTESEKNLADTKEQINSAFSEKAKIEKEQVITLQQSLCESEGYQKLLSEREELKKKYESVSIDDEATEKLADLEAKKSECSEILSRCNAQLATKDQYDKIQGLISGIKQEQKDLVSQLSELERKEDIARRYQDRQNAILEERINQHFSLVQWRMFRTVNNNGDPFDEPFCECYVDGVAYHDGLNQAARLNAGLDIINALCRHFRVSAPIVLDNSESTINIIGTIGQQIRLQVADTDLQIV